MKVTVFGSLQIECPYNCTLQIIYSNDQVEKCCFVPTTTFRFLNLLYL